MLNVNQDRRDEYIKKKTQEDEQRMMTGKTVKLNPLERSKMKEERIQERIDYERMQLQMNGYEVLYPQIYEDKQEEYDKLLKKAYDIWDDFTTGKNKK